MTSLLRNSETVKRGGHASLVALGHALIVDRHIGGREHPPERLFGLQTALAILEAFQSGLDGQAAGDVAMALPPHAVGEHRHGAAGTLLLQVRRLEEPEEVLVLRPHGSRGRETSVAQLHDRLRLVKETAFVVPSRRGRHTHTSYCILDAISPIITAPDGDGNEALARRSQSRNAGERDLAEPSLRRQHCNAAQISDSMIAPIMRIIAYIYAFVGPISQNVLVVILSLDT